MELTRLRRFLRKNNRQPFIDAQKMIDVMDIIGENAENYEYWMGKEDINPGEDNMKNFVKFNTYQVLALLMDIELIGIQGIVGSLATNVGYERVFDVLQNWKKNDDEQKRLDKEFEELDDHPW